jgi:hypothetical protein
MGLDLQTFSVLLIALAWEKVGEPPNERPPIEKCRKEKGDQ